MSLHFYDAAEPRNVPSGVHAAVYINGHFRWPVGEVRRMAKVIRITVWPGAEWAQDARCIDIENGDATPADAIPFLIARQKHYGDATAYCDRSALPEVRQLCERAGISPRLWVATLDGTQYVPGAWAVQYRGGVNAGYDLSVLYGKDDFHAP